MRFNRCIFDQVLRFSRRLPGHTELIETLTSAWDAGLVLPSTGQNADSREKRRRWDLAELEDIGAPRWLLRLFDRAVRWRARSGVE